MLTGLEAYDAFSDWDREGRSNLAFKEMDQQYPGSKFILNTRELTKWLDSREKHVIRNQKKDRKKPGIGSRWLQVDRDTWEEHYKDHHRQVRNYFAERAEDLLEIDVTKGEGWEKLCPFLGVSIPEKPFPVKNTANKNSFFYMVKRNILRRLDN